MVQRKPGKNGGSPRGRGRPAYDDVLTPAEWRVVHAAQHGLSNRAIADRLGISADGVKYHLANALGKLQLAGKAELKSWFKSPRSSALAAKMNADQDLLASGKLNTEPYSRDQQKGKAMNIGNSQSLVVENLGQVSRTVRSLEKSIEFYEKKLGIPHLYTFGDLAFFDLAGTRLFLTETAEVNQSESILYFSVADIKQACDSLSEAGVEISNQPHLIHTHEDGSEEWMAFLKDLEGRALGLMSLVSPVKP